MSGTLGPTGTVKLNKTIVTVYQELASLPTISVEVDTSVLPKEGDIVAGRYRLTKLLGEGAFGRVFQANHTEIDKHRVAMKIVGGELYVARNPAEELRLLAAVAHPNVVQLADHGIERSNGRIQYVWLTMPFYEGQTLAARIKQSPLTLREAHTLFAPIARGLAAMHAIGLRHQDIKPDNIFIARLHEAEHYPVVLDLGAAAGARAAAPIAGTLAYASPEQVRAIVAMFAHKTEQIPLMETMDTYCLAVTLLEAIAGSRFQDQLVDRNQTADELGKLLKKVHDERWKDPLPQGALPAVRGKARGEIVKCFRIWLHEDPSQRSSMAAFARQLDVLLEPEKQAVEHRRYWRFGGGVLALCGVLASGGCAYKNRTELAFAAYEEMISISDKNGRERETTLEGCQRSLVGVDGQLSSCREDLKAANMFREDLKLSLGVKSGCTSEEHTSYGKLIKNCQDQREALTGEREQCRSELLLRTHERDDLVATRDRLRAELTTCGQVRDRLNGEWDQCRGDLVTCAQVRDRFQGELVTCSQARDRFQGDLGTCAQVRDRFQGDLGTCGHARDRLEAAVAACQQTPTQQGGQPPGGGPGNPSPIP